MEFFKKVRVMTLTQGSRAPGHGGIGKAGKVESNTTTFHGKILAGYIVRRV